MLKKTKYQPTEKEQAFLDSVHNSKYDRQIITGIRKFVDGTAPEDMKGFYSDAELEKLSALTGTPLDVEKRMPVKMTRHYFELAKNSPPLMTTTWSLASRWRNSWNASLKKPISMRPVSSSRTSRRWSDCRNS